MGITKFNPIKGRWPFGNFSSPVLRQPANGMATRQQEHPPSCTAEPISGISGVEAERVATNKESTKHILGDVLLVMLWGAMIPGMMWLGHAAGF